MEQTLETLVENAMTIAEPWKKNGQVASYIPELSNADPKQLGISLMTKDGRLYSAGDSDYAFTIQSIVKCYFLLFALDKWGEDIVFSLVHMEPSGASFQSPAITPLPQIRPANPFINAGALVLCSLIASTYSLEEFVESLAQLISREDLPIDRAVYQSEYAHSQANRQSLNKLAELELLRADRETTLDFYIKSCAILMDTKDLARMAWAFKHHEAISPRHRLILESLMFTCGMYNGSGEYAVRVGIPSKSGVGGGLIALHDDYCFGLYAPALDPKGNSLAARKAMAFFSEELRLHVFDRTD
ncbi:MAG TPA: glutaminase A [Tissierellia bacterium]|nr:glutaminase A [Tissierellia bacterium]